MILAVALAAVAPPPNVVSASVTAGVAYSQDFSTEGPYLGGVGLVGARAQYERTIGSGVFIGALGGYERAECGDNTPSAHVAMMGGVLGGRWGNHVRGGVSLVGGGVYAAGAYYDYRFWSTGWFGELDAEITHRSKDNWEWFALIPIVWVRSFDVAPSSYHPTERWSYFLPLVPLAINTGLRIFF